MEDFKGFKGLEYIGSNILEALVKLILNGEEVRLAGTLEDGQVLMRVLDGTTHYWTNRTPGYPEGPDISGKVDKVPGYGLSKNDFTDALKALLEQQSNTNTGDETFETIIDKLGLESPIVTQEDLIAVLADYVAKETGKSLISDTEIARLASIKQGFETIVLPAASTVAGRCTTPTLIPEGWYVSEGSSDQDLLITHTRTTSKIVDIKVWAITPDGDRLRIGGLAYVGILAPSTSSIIVESLATIEVPLRIELIFN